jgi:hypothetical protein
MLCRMRLLAVLIASLAFSAAPALAQDEAPVGEGQVITDIATEVEPPPGEDDGTDIPPVDDGTPAPEPEPDASGRRGEVHVLDSATSSSPTTAATTPTPSPAAVPAPARAAATPARPIASGKTLPFTGVNAGVLALIGGAMLAAGSGLLAVLRQPVQ